MKTQVWCQAFWDDGVQHGGFLVMELDLPGLMHEGDYLELFDGWSMCRVLRCIYQCHCGVALVEIGPDTTGEIREEMARQKGKR